MTNLAFVITAAYHGTGRHASELPPTEIPVGLKVRANSGETLHVLTNSSGGGFVNPSLS